MKKDADHDELKKLLAMAKAMRTLVIFSALVLLISQLMPEQFRSFFSPKTPRIVENETVSPENSDILNGVHVVSGLVADTGYEKIITHCGSCHSLKLVTQNRATREGWKSIIEWMQQTQNLWDLGEDEDAILAYLSKHYAPEKKGRRQPLKNIEWYALDK